MSRKSDFSIARLPLASETTDASSGVIGSSVFDFNADGAAEVVYRDEFQLRIFDGSDGTVLFALPVSSITQYELPVIAGVDGDGHTEIVVVADSLCAAPRPMRSARPAAMPQLSPVQRNSNHVIVETGSSNGWSTVELN